jgi:hypothetical protein
MTGFRGALLACAVSIALVAGSRGSLAQGGDPPPAPATAECQILEIKASNDGDGVDPELKPLARKLKKPPFSSWKAFKLLKRHDKTVEKMKALNLGLVTGSKLALLFRGASGGQTHKTRLRLGFTLDDKTGKRKLDGTISLDSGDYSLIGGDSIEGGATYIVAVSCKAP